LKNSNIRTEPTTKSKIVTTLRKGEKVIKIDESDKWFNVKLPSGETGWVLKSLAKEAE
jgi:N-acetylmuramoyl-L-alanine amidase